MVLKICTLKTVSKPNPKGYSKHLAECLQYKHPISYKYLHKQWFSHLIQNIYLKARAIFSSLYGENSEAFPHLGLEENAHSTVIYLWNKFKNARCKW